MAPRYATDSYSGNAREHCNESSATEQSNDRLEHMFIDNLKLLLIDAAKEFASNLPAEDVEMHVTDAISQWSASAVAGGISFGDAEMKCHNKIASIIMRYHPHGEVNFRVLLL